MRFKLIAVVALALLAGCATPPPPEPGSAASKVVAMGKLKNIVVGAMRVARENGFHDGQCAAEQHQLQQPDLLLPLCLARRLKASRLPKKKPGKA